MNICLLLPALGCIIAFGVLKASTPHIWTRPEIALLSTFGALYFLLVLFPFLVYAIGIPLAYRAWLASFDDKWNSDRSYRGWSRWLSFDSAVQEWTAYCFGTLFAGLSLLYGRIFMEEMDKDEAKNVSVTGCGANVETYDLPEVYVDEDGEIRRVQFPGIDNT